MRIHKRHLQHNASTRFPSLCLAFDTETLPEDLPNVRKGSLHKLRLWAAYSWRFDKGKVTRNYWHNGVRCEDFWEKVYSLTSEHKPLYLFAHNVAFDLTVLRFWEQLQRGKLTLHQPANWRGNGSDGTAASGRLGVLCITDPPTIIECWLAGTRRRIIILDTLNYWRCPLADLGADLGLPKAPMPGETADFDDWLCYCRRDVEIVSKAVVFLHDFIRENDAGVFKYTISSQAMASFKHAHMKHKISLHREEEPLRMEREAYRGGEVKLSYCGVVTCNPIGDLFSTNGTDHKKRPVRKGPVYVYDVQSFYPSVMRDNLFPCELLGSVIAPSRTDLEYLMSKYYVFARVNLKTYDHAYPVKKDGESLMAIGKFGTVLCGPELWEAWRRGHIEYLGRVCWYRQEKLFEHFVNYWYAKRVEAKKAKRPEIEMMIKTLLNSLFGKFGQRMERWLDVPNKKSPRPWGFYLDLNEETDEYEWFRSICWRTQIQNDEGEHKESFPAIAAAVTACGRHKMYTYRNWVGERNVYYQDTDSLHLNREGAVALAKGGGVLKGEIGRFCLKGIYREAEYRGIKDYTLDGQRVIAGIKRSATVVGQDEYEQTEFQRLSSILSREPLPGVVVREVTVPRSDRLPPGRVSEDGTVSPPVLP